MSGREGANAMLEDRQTPHLAHRPSRTARQLDRYLVSGQTPPRTTVYSNGRGHTVASSTRTRVVEESMSLPTIGTLTSVPVDEHPELLAEPVRSALADWPHTPRTAVVEIDPALADTAAMTEAYSVSLEASANCVVVLGRRGGQERIAACVVRADMRADVNNVVRRLLDVRKASFLSMERAVEETGMEYGGITPLGLPPSWPVLVDSAVVDAGDVVIGSGIRGSKLILPGALLVELPGGVVVAGLAAAAPDGSQP
jgi:prolyl-tRNA editing enzyme YbaK/EbsC (Cys-tRNA(Pro) deacylase)